MNDGKSAVSRKASKSVGRWERIRWIQTAIPRAFQVGAIGGNTLFRQRHSVKLCQVIGQS